MWAAVANLLLVCGAMLFWLVCAIVIFLVIRPWYRKWYARLGRHPTLDDVMEADLFAVFRRAPAQEADKPPPPIGRTMDGDDLRKLKIDRSRQAELELIQKMEDSDPYVRKLAKKMLAERYWAGICDEDPGPPLTPEEQRDLNWKMYCIQRSYDLVTFVLGDGMDPLLTSGHKNEWEESIEGMELVGAVKRAQACREVLLMFKKVMKPGRREDLGFEMMMEIRQKDVERYCELERGIADESEWGLIEDYVIRNRELFLRNRGDGSWRELGMGIQ